MTVRDIYEGALMDLNKVHAPAFTVEEFVYFINKAILAFTNERYNFYAVNQQLSDDLRVLLVEEEIPYADLTISTDISNDRFIEATLTGDDYFRLVSFDLIVQNTISLALKKYVVKRLTTDMYGAIANNEYLKPALYRPYYMLLPVDAAGEQNNSTLKIFIGDVVSTLIPYALRVFYLRLPAVVTLTDDMVYNLVADTSEILEWPDYLKNEFIKRVVWYQLEETRDQRLQTFPSLNQEILTVPLELMGGQQTSYPKTK